MSPLKSLCFSLALAYCQQVSAGNVEVLHWWTSGGEAKSVESLKSALKARGHSWEDIAVAGLAGENAMNVLITRAMSGNPPSAAQIKGPDIREWGRLGFLTNLDDVAQKESWDQLLPSQVANIMKYDGHYVAVPFNIHRVNWLWVNPEVMKKAGVTVPQTLDEFFTTADKLQEAGYIAVALSDEAWQEATIFDAIALSVLGARDYEKAFVQLDEKTLSGPKMAEAFRQFKRMKKYMDPEAAGRKWNESTDLVIQGKAAMQWMGDWAKGEFAAEGKQPGKDYLCAPAPGTKNTFMFNIDSFAFFSLQNKDDTDAQKALASAILDPAFQRTFNLNKGSIPVRVDMDLNGFDQCSVDAMNAFLRGAATNQLVPSLSHGLASTRYVQNAVFDVVSQFFQSDTETPEQAAEKLAKAIYSVRN